MRPWDGQGLKGPPTWSLFSSFLASGLLMRLCPMSGISNYAMPAFSRCLIGHHHLPSILERETHAFLGVGCLGFGFPSILFLPALASPPLPLFGIVYILSSSDQYGVEFCLFAWFFVSFFFFFFSLPLHDMDLTDGKGITILGLASCLRLLLAFYGRFHQQDPWYMYGPLVNKIKKIKKKKTLIFFLKISLLGI